MSEISYETLDSFAVAAVRHKGKHDYRITGATWEELILWASPRRLLGRMFDVNGIGVLWDDPRYFGDEDRHYDAGIPIDVEDAAEVEDPAHLLFTLPGEYLKVRHQGPYDEILGVYEMIFNVALRYESVRIGAAPFLEFYRNSPAEVAVEDLVTDIYLPVSRD